MPRVTRITGTHCTVERHTGQFCDAPTAEDVPFPICARHAMKLYRHMRSILTEAARSDMNRLGMVLELAQEMQLASEKEGAAYVARRHIVYYVKIGDLIKVGHTINFQQRMQSYPPGRKVLATEPGDRDLECQRHAQFASLRERGHEWYRPGPALIEHINRLRRASGATPVTTDHLA